MTTSLYSLSVESYLQSLTALDGIMKKAEAHCSENDIHPDSLVALRLCDDMLPFQFQILSVIGQSTGAIASLHSGVSLPPEKSEPMTFKQLHDLVQAAIEELKGMDETTINALSGGEVVFKFGGNDFPFTTENFVLSFSLPNLYFHATTAYDLLRREGVPLGKRYFLGPLKITK